MADRVDIEFPGEEEATLRGWLYRPEGAEAGPRPAITMAHGFAAVKEHGLDRFARAFAQAGFVVLVHDHRGFGVSDGSPRHDIDPWRQIADWRRAISYLESRPEVDGSRLGIWGTSYAGGHAIMLGATDRRIRCVVAQVLGEQRQVLGFEPIGPQRSSNLIPLPALALGRIEQPPQRGAIIEQPVDPTFLPLFPFQVGGIVLPYAQNASTKALIGSTPGRNVRKHHPRLSCPVLP
jgi:pimeloyl-ACP methyl ester carboxylesterase